MGLHKKGTQVHPISGRPEEPFRCQEGLLAVDDVVSCHAQKPFSITFFSQLSHRCANTNLCPT